MTVRPKIERMCDFRELFTGWHDPPGVQILRRVDRRVIVDTHKAWPAPYWPPDAPNAGSVRPMSFAAAEVRNHGLHLETLHEGRQVAWIRQSTGQFLGLVLVDAVSRDGRSQMTMPLWLQSSTFRLPRPDGS
ncbi:hypothetical protein [Mycobacteroides abscessus]|uniref:hypothetical protein n=1 Tax=Mycobacteroides abscessus TaxID=36809 RepID=UPI0010481D58|nr:hypothetical protein [Mycobacteroides abscessus]